ncbi:probable serine/threonine-protein kinase DDB_G0272282 isoform X2 [Sitodiplosis mosellana]|uniref:probable serine/threonine-protein kinase DDB_G0272282 isoform X2 n=1 Tax=Sitodiplosis mosellana TaxID=263140 RepID=UPI002443C327|nr:probable serine/threonine-protein kinase DDB_G0272282 isoform X2 [Sitodiplosis mosellana]
MPWNCLCSSKSKNRRPQISAPILNTEDIQKLQLIPLQKPLITSKNLHEKLIQPENDAVGVSQALHNNIGIENVSSANIDDDDDDDNHNVEKPLQSAQSAIDLARAQLDSVDDNKPLVTTTTTEAATTIATGKLASAITSKSMKKDIKRTKRLEKKRLKQQQKQLKKLNKKEAKKEKNNNKIKDEQKTNNGSSSSSNNNNKPNETLQSNLKNRSQSFPEPTVPRAKSKSPVNVTFAFDTIENGSDANNHNRTTIVLHHSHKDITHDQQYIDDGGNDSKSIGEYDSLPLIKVEKSADVDSDFAVETRYEKIDGNGNVVVVNNAPLPISCSSSDSIPFIDDSPNPRRAASIPIEPHRNLHDSRFITLQPRNIGAQSMIYARKLEKPLPIAFKIPTKRDQFDKSAQILYQSLKESIDHHFDRVAHVHNKLCQVCHEFLLVPDAVKCLTCGLVCHQSCTLPQVRKIKTIKSEGFCLITSNEVLW